MRLVRFDFGDFNGWSTFLVLLVYVLWLLRSHFDFLLVRSGFVF